jgi:hypothetical protein
MNVYETEAEIQAERERLLLLLHEEASKVSRRKGELYLAMHHLDAFLRGSGKLPVQPVRAFYALGDAAKAVELMRASLGAFMEIAVELEKLLPDE